MQIAPTGGAAETGVSEAKLKPSPGEVKPVAGAEATSLLKSVQQALLADVVSLSDFAAATLLAPTQLIRPQGASDPSPVLQVNGMQINSGGGAGAISGPDARLAPASSPTVPVNAVGGGTAPAKTLPPPPIGDVANVRAVAATDLLKLTQILQPVNPPERILRVDSLIRETVSAIREGRVEFAVGRLIEAATADPARVDEIRSLPELEPIRANVEHVVAHLANVAKMDAETKLTSTEELFENSSLQKLPHWETAPGELLSIAHRLIEVGGYVNYVRTAELATTLQSAYWAATAVDPLLLTDASANLKKVEDARRKGAGPATFALFGHAWDAVREKGPGGIRAAWNRAPLLVLFAAWLGLGLAGGVVSKLAGILSPGSWIVGASNFGFEVWALGFLVLVGLGFWAGVRKRRS